MLLLGIDFETTGLDTKTVNEEVEHAGFRVVVQKVAPV